MARSSQSRGMCASCGEELGKRAMLTHFDKCAKRQDALRLAESSNRPVETLWHIRVQAAGWPHSLHSITGILLRASNAIGCRVVAFPCREPMT